MIHFSNDLPSHAVQPKVFMPSPTRPDTRSIPVPFALLYFRSSCWRLFKLRVGVKPWLLISTTSWRGLHTTYAPVCSLVALRSFLTYTAVYDHELEDFEVR